MPGIYFPKDYTLAVKWLRKGIAQNDSAAKYLLGLAYEHGYGVERSKAEALRLYKEAARQGHSGAFWKLEQIYDYA